MSHLLAVTRLLELAGLHLVVALLLLIAEPVRLVWTRGGYRLQNGVLHLWARGVVTILGMRVCIEGSPPRPPFFLVTNHLGYMDIIVLGTCLDACFVSKSEVARWPVMGLLARAGRTIFVERGRRSDLGAVIGTMQRALDAGQGVVFFPEGTSSPGERVLPFKPPLFEAPVRTGVPVTCASLSYQTPEGLPPAHLAICWWGDMSFADHFYELLQIPRSQAALVFGESLTPTDRKELAARSYEAVSRSFRPCVEVSS